ncbi:MAG: hypothetical protein KME43_19060 [Myxacorys chilensis ATA2-1-KO14]|jgi:hypothetical protein|nr:hypothetical protein [Myxacorys chilensis ATA2-1-KO14]
MQLQVEHNSSLLQKQSCLICKQLFEMTEAKIIICNEQGTYYGEVCPKCLEKGFDWLSDRFERLNQSRKTIVIEQTPVLEIPISA